MHIIFLCRINVLSSQTLRNALTTALETFTVGSGAKVIHSEDINTQVENDMKPVIRRPQPVDGSAMDYYILQKQWENR